MATSTRKSRESEFHRSTTPSGRLGSRSLAHAADMSSPFASSTNSSFCSAPSSYVYGGRPSSPTRVNLHGLASITSSSARVSIASRSGSPKRAMAVGPRNQAVRKQAGRSSQKTCLCSPTTHPGSFRCSLHKNYNSSHSLTSYTPNRLNARRSAMTNSLVRIATAEGGDLVKRALAALIRPSSHQQRRRSVYEPRRSRLSIMSNAGDL